jgi:hypothetical protein
MTRHASFFICILLLLAHTASGAAEAVRPLSFVHDVQPILTKAGCNAGACHAKAITGTTRL